MPVCVCQLEQMDLEVRGLASPDRQKYSTRLQSYKSELTKLERDLVSTVGKSNFAHLQSVVQHAQ